MKITRKTIKRTLRTFLQAFIGSFVSAGMLVGWNDTDLKKSFFGCLITGFFSGLAALGMNLEKKEIDDYE